MIVSEPSKRALRHDIAKVVRALVFGDLAREGLSEPKMTGFPRDLVSELEEAVGGREGHAP